jgi:hypothetical protein
VADLPPLTPLQGVRVARTLGECGTRFTARTDRRALGFIEIDTALSRPERHARSGGLADIGNFHIEHPMEGLENWLLAQAAHWLRLCGVERLLAYETADDTEAIGRLIAAGFHELTRTDRGWVHEPNYRARRGS